MSLGDAIARLAPELPAFEPGHVWLAGAGPGALGCLTLEVVAALAVDPIDRTAIIFVGPGLAAEDFRESALYDPGYQRRFRGRAT